MSIVIVEIKARCDEPERVRSYLTRHHARFIGEDHQVDTYFAVRDGRLKLREGTIENALIYYERADQAGPKRSDVRLHKTPKDAGLKAILLSVFDVLVCVEKRREISFIDNVKFHVDHVEGLGSFVEIEAISEEGSLTEEQLRDQCTGHLEALGIATSDLLTSSYSDMLLAF